MNAFLKQLRNIVAAALALASSCALADSQPVAMPADTKLVVFTFDQNNTYTILTRPRNVTNIVLSADEEIVAMALGDTVQWIVSDAPGNIFIKPLHPGIVTSGTLVTNKRTYQLSLRSSPEDGKFYQRVSWEYPDMIILKQQRAAKIKESVDVERAHYQSTVVSADINVEKLNFDYSIEGEADWKPTQVFDDGKFTGIKLKKTQDIPVLFALSQDGKVELVNTNIRGEYIIAQRLLPKIMLKLGKQEVRITNRKLAPSSFFGLFRD